MIKLIKTEFLKYKRYNIVWLGIVSIFFPKVNEDRAESPGTPQFQGFPHNLKTWVSLCFPFYPERFLM